MTLSLSAVRAPSRSAPRSAPIATFFAVWQERRALAKMDDTRLRDLGISADDAAREAARPIWDLNCIHRR